MLTIILFVLSALASLFVLFFTLAPTRLDALKKALPFFTVTALLGVFLIVGGCALLGQPIADKVADAIDTNCDEPLNARQVYRDAINDELADDGHRIEVTCAGDPGG